jgi:hypothetical protein
MPPHLRPEPLLILLFALLAANLLLPLLCQVDDSVDERGDANRHAASRDLESLLDMHVYCVFI